jgi:uncharacterized membrane protein
MKSARVLAAVLAAFVFSLPAPGQTPALYLMGNGIPGGQSRVMGLSADGSAAAGMTTGAFPNNGNSWGFRWTQGTGRVDFAHPPAVTAALGLSSDGSTVVGQTGTAALHSAYRRVGESALENLGMQSGYTTSYATAANQNGSAVVGTSERQHAIDGQAFRWTPSTGLQGLGFLRPNGTYSEANAISDDGNVVVGQSQSNGTFGVYEAFTWTSAGGMRSLPVLTGTSGSSAANGISGDGRIVVGSADDGVNIFAVRWLEGRAENLGSVAGLQYPVAFGANSDGSVIFGRGNSTSDNDAFVWKANIGMMVLTDYLRANGVPLPQDVSIPFCEAISGDGRSFGGVLVSASLGNQGFVATIPQPVGFVGPVVAAYVVYRRRRPKIAANSQ